MISNTREIILAAGALWLTTNPHAVRYRAGRRTGPVGIPTTADLPVGANLQDHPLLAMSSGAFKTFKTY